eukprot:gene5173-12131_t
MSLQRADPRTPATAPRLAWDDLTAHVIDSHVRGRAARPDEAVLPYECVAQRQQPDPFHALFHLPHWGGCGRLVGLAKDARDDPPFQLICPRSLTQPATWRLPPAAAGEGVPTACEYIPAPLDLFVTASSDTRLRFYDDDMALNHTAQGGDTTALRVRWRAVVDKLFVAARDGTLTSFDVVPRAGDDSDEEAHWLRGGRGRGKTRATAQWFPHHSALTDFLFLPNDEQRIVTASLDGAISCMDLEKSYPRGPAAAHQPGERVAPPAMACHKRDIGRHGNGVLHLAYNELAQLLVSVGYEKNAYCWSPSAAMHREELHDLTKPHRAPLVGVCSIAGTPQVVTADTAGMLKVWDLRTLRCSQTVQCGWDPDSSVRGSVLPGQQTSPLTGLCYVPQTGEIAVARGRRPAATAAGRAVARRTRRIAGPARDAG